jgi:hypothetical protein
LPTYDFNNFKLACCKAGQVYATQQAREDADHWFNLKTQRSLLEFINSDGLEKMTHYSTKLWENNPSPEIPIMVDAYKFKTGNLRGYIAFFYVEKTKKWIIKSFKFDRDRNELMAQAFKEAGFCIPWESGEEDGNKT